MTKTNIRLELTEAQYLYLLDTVGFAVNHDAEEAEETIDEGDRRHYRQMAALGMSVLANITADKVYVEVEA